MCVCETRCKYSNIDRSDIESKMKIIVNGTIRAYAEIIYIIRLSRYLRTLIILIQAHPSRGP